ncbi:MAG: ABC transporter substrate-binding protein [Anaerolineae bacterium]|nr:ABC transporter substrate-binding protein [Anaerolineae bacterium]
MRALKRLIILLAIATVVVGCTGATAAPPAATERVKIAMGFIPNVQFTPMYVALEQGFFAEEGLELELDYGMEADILGLLGAGQLQFAIGSGDQVVLARAAGLPVVYVYDWYNRFPVSVVSLAASGIESVEDLKGKTVGVSHLAGASYIGWRALAEAGGLQDGDVTLQAIGYTQVAALTSGQVDAAVCYYMNEPVQLQTAGEAVSQILVNDITPLPSNGIITNEATISGKPDLIRRLLRAFDRGLRYTLDNPDEAFAIAEKAVPEIEGAREVQRAVFEACLELWDTDELGVSSDEAWSSAAEFMLRDGLVDVAVDPASAFTNEFLSED